MHWVNGNRAEQVSVQDRGLLYGDGLFETMLWDGQRIQLLSFHLERLRSGCDLLKIKYPHHDLPLQLQSVVAAIVAEGLPSAVIRLTVTRGQGLRGYAARSANNPTTIFSVAPATMPLSASNARLHLCENRLAIGSPLCGLKHLNRLEQVLLANEVELSGCDEGLVLDCEGTVVSGTRSNIFIVADSRLYTPALDRCGILGTVRRLVIERLAGELNLEVRTGRLSLSEVKAASELFYCNSLVGIMPVARFGATRYNNFVITEAISAALKHAVAKVH